MNDRANPYAVAASEYGPIASIHNAQATGAPVAPRTARTQAYVTPYALWNLSGIASNFNTSLSILF